MIAVYLLYIKHAQNSMLKKPQIILGSDGIILKLMTKFKRGEHCMQEHLYQHFYSDGHNGFLKDVKIMLINKTDCKDPKNRENYWVRTFKILAPDGLKI